MHKSVDAATRRDAHWLFLEKRWRITTERTAAQKELPQ